ncbi:hypothetical protein DFA_00779 [Cavenderia fasciculata]|uniref:RRM domain-containing protein n=1 Tax=Cavenderia fasciculata TaxID=261658 RepID=F4PTT3_CACFS|nr:uncharacterized protein DFA_00779 [Cavenderia fasciculata]EGG20912.1 hypothetical protein DFA_00779 [Cavenderia fasciculata]|eukprot:XP_004358762.1 hypothetical protein DFA_00779 [Cavenderia fasciculata]
MLKKVVSVGKLSVLPSSPLCFHHRGGAVLKQSSSSPVSQSIAVSLPKLKLYQQSFASAAAVSSSSLFQSTIYQKVNEMSAAVSPQTHVLKRFYCSQNVDPDFIIKKLWIDDVRNVKFDLKVFLTGTPLKSLVSRIQNILPKEVSIESLTMMPLSRGAYITLKYHKSLTFKDVMMCIIGNAYLYNLRFYCSVVSGAMETSHYKINTSKTLFVKCVGSAHDGDIHNLLGTCGIIKKMKRIDIPSFGKFKLGTYFLVTFKDHQQAIRALKCMDKSDFGDCYLFVKQYESLLEIMVLISLLVLIILIRTNQFIRQVFGDEYLKSIGIDDSKLQKVSKLFGI